MGGATAAHDVGHVIQTRRAAGLLVEIHSLEAEERVGLGADLLVALFLGKGFVIGELGIGNEAGAGADHMLRFVHESAQSPQDALAAQDGGGVFLHVADHAPWDDGGVGVRVKPGGRPNRFGVDSAEECRGFGRIGAGAFGKLFESDGAILDEFAVVQAFFDDDVDPGEQQCPVGSVIDAEVMIGKQRGIGDAGVDLDELRSPCQRRFQFEEFGGPKLLPAILSEVDDKVGVLPIGGGVPAVRRTVHLSGVAHAEEDRCDVVRASEVVHESSRDAAEPGVEGHFGYGKRFGAVFLDDCSKALGYFVKGLAPFDLPPNGVRSRSYVLSRFRDAVGVVAVVAPQVRFRADGGQVWVERGKGDAFVVSNGDGASPVAEYARAVPESPGVDISHENLLPVPLVFRVWYLFRGVSDRA